MSLSQQEKSSATGRFAALKTKHQDLKEKIRAEQLSPAIDGLRLQALKKEKLRIKEEIYAEK